MGRGKGKQQYIENEKERKICMKNRKAGLIKKLHQLTTLCDVPACMIIHDRTANSTSVWPEDNPAQVRTLIDAYRAKKKDNPTAVKPYGLSDYYIERQRQAEDELKKLRKRNAEFPSLDDMDKAQLTDLAAKVRGKKEAVSARIDFLKREAKAVDVNEMVMELEKNAMGKVLDVNEMMMELEKNAMMGKALDVNEMMIELEKNAMMAKALDVNGMMMMMEKEFYGFRGQDMIMSAGSSSIPVPDYCSEYYDFGEIMSAGSSSIPVPDYCSEYYDFGEIMSAGSSSIPVPDYCSEYVFN